MDDSVSRFWDKYIEKSKHIMALKILRYAGMSGMLRITFIATLIFACRIIRLIMSINIFRTKAVALNFLIGNSNSLLPPSGFCLWK